MGVVNVNSNFIANTQAQPVVLSNPALTADRVRSVLAAMLTGAADSNGSTYRFFRVPSNAVVTSIDVMNDANTSGSSYKCGVLGINGGGVAVAGSDQIFFSGVAMSSARNGWTGLLFPAILTATGSGANVEKRIWELLGLTADSNLLYDVAITAVAAGSAGGNMALKMSYLQ